MNNPPRTVIYTAVFGKRDWAPSLAKGVLEALTKAKAALVCFTPEDDLIAYGAKKKWPWEFVKVARRLKDDKKGVREYKLRPHAFLATYDHSLWIDANIGILANPLPLIKTTLAASRFAVYKHPNNIANAYQEADRCIVRQKDGTKTIAEQIEAYQALGLPRGKGPIPMCGILMRRHMETACVDFGNAWFEEIEHHSARDQIAFPFVAWLRNFQYSWIDAKRAAYFHIGPHKPRHT